MNRNSIWLIVALIASCAVTGASDGDGLGRIVAVGDVHGDYDNFIAVLQDTGIVDKRGRWDAGRTRFVQVGDIPDRGPDTRKIMDFMMKLEKQAQKAGGAVHALIGNHEAMNIQGDLRYVHPGEFEAFRDRNSKKRRELYYEQSVKYIKETQPEEVWPAFDEEFRQRWEDQYPLGYVEHRIAWAPTGDYGKWVLSHDAIIKIDDTLFVHGGLAPPYSAMPLAEINTRIRTELASSERLGPEAMINADNGPLWYRGLANLAETDENEAVLDQMLANYDAKRIVIAHTPRLGTVVPRFNSKVLLVDVGLSDYYGGARAALLLEGDEQYVVQNGQRFDLPDDDDGVVAFLEAVAPLVPKPARITEYIQERSEQPQQTVPAETDDAEQAAAAADAA